MVEGVGLNVRRTQRAENFEESRPLPVATPTARGRAFCNLLLCTFVYSQEPLGTRKKRWKASVKLLSASEELYNMIAVGASISTKKTRAD